MRPLQWKLVANQCHRGVMRATGNEWLLQWRDNVKSGPLVPASPPAGYQGLGEPHRYCILLAPVMGWPLQVANVMDLV